MEDSLMCISDVRERLQAEGFRNAAGYRIYYAITNGKVSRPPMNKAHQFVFGDKHLEELRAYFLSDPRPGRKPNKVKETANAPAAS
jgi:hypothetical protein